MKKILIVDDDKNIRKILEIALEEEWTVVAASSGEEAVELATNEQPELILLDRMMPGMDGLSTLRELRSREATKSVPVIFLTARVQTQDLEDYSGEGVLGLLSKPFDPVTLVDEINELLARRDEAVSS